jgi:pyrophosphate--fructose-6-phosphate 1-phosphotransferase
MPRFKIAMLTAGGLAPCLASAVGGLIDGYSKIAPDADIIAYRSGYDGLLQGRSMRVTPDIRAKAHVLHRHGGSPIGNSRIKLTNAADCVKRGLVKPGENPLQVAAEQLQRDGINVLHTIGGDDTSTTAADLVAYLSAHGYELTVVGLPKTVDNDFLPIGQSLGAATAAEHGAIFFRNVVNEYSAAPRMLLVHEVMGRNCGWLTAATGAAWRRMLSTIEFLPELNFGRSHFDIDAIYVPEVTIDMSAEASRLKEIMDRKGSVNIFLSEGAGAAGIVADMEAAGEKVTRDAFGHVKLDTIDVGQRFGKRLAGLIGAGRTLVQKSGYFARSAAPNSEDLELIRTMVGQAIDSAVKRESGVVGHDEDRGGALRTIEFNRIKGGKKFDLRTEWFTTLLGDIGQLQTVSATARKTG